MNIDQISDVVVLVVASLVLILLATIISADKTPKRYYIEHDGGTPCAYGDSDWYPDSKAFCSTDIEELIVIVHRMNNRYAVPQQVPGLSGAESSNPR